MIFVTGPLFAGKKEYIRSALGLSEAEFAVRARWDLETLAAETMEDIPLLADSLMEWDILIASETGCGVIPVDPEERTARERAGRLSVELARRADTVIRVQCGLGQVLKGELPWNSI